VDLFIVLGRVDLQTEDGLAIDVEQIIVHPDWDVNTGQNGTFYRSIYFDFVKDVALIKMKDKAEISDAVGRRCKRFLLTLPSNSYHVK
jgi:hypothetical protein